MIGNAINWSFREEIEEAVAGQYDDAAARAGNSFPRTEEELKACVDMYCQEPHA